MAAGCIYDSELTILWRAVPFSINVLWRGQWQWGGTPIGLSVKLTHLGHPHNRQNFQYKTRHYWLQRNGILARFDYLDHLPFKAPRPFETSGITHIHTTPLRYIPLDLSPTENPSSNLIAYHMVKKLLILLKWVFVSAFTKTGPLDCLHAHTNSRMQLVTSPSYRRLVINGSVLATIVYLFLVYSSANSYETRLLLGAITNANRVLYITTHIQIRSTCIEKFSNSVMMYQFRTVHQASGSNFDLPVIVLPPKRNDNLNVRTDKQRTRNCRNISSMLKQTTGLVTLFSWTFCVRLKCHCTSIHNSCSHSLALLSWEILSHRTTTPGNKRQNYLQVSRQASTPLAFTQHWHYTSSMSYIAQQPCTQRKDYSCHLSYTKHTHWAKPAAYNTVAAACGATRPCSQSYFYFIYFFIFTFHRSELGYNNR
jgi:hypothetical protein